MAVSNHVGSVLYKAGVYMLIQKDIDLHSTGTALYVRILELAKRQKVFFMLYWCYHLYIVIREGPNFQALMVPMEVCQGQASTKQRWHSQILITIM